jgi:hypothetical protein
MTNDCGVTHIRLRGTNPQLPAVLPGLHSLRAQCTTLGSFVDEALRYLTSLRLTLTTFEYHAGTREVTLLVRG